MRLDSNSSAGQRLNPGTGIFITTNGLDQLRVPSVAAETAEMQGTVYERRLYLRVGQVGTRIDSANRGRTRSEDPFKRHDSDRVILQRRGAKLTRCGFLETICHGHVRC